MADRNFWEFVDDFFGTAIFLDTQANNTGWRFTTTGTTPLATLSTPSSSGELTIVMDASEIQNASVTQGDILQYDIDKIKEVEFRVKMGQATIDTASSVAFGIASARNDAIDSLAVTAIFRVIGADDTTAVVVETDADGAGDNNDIATGATLANVYKDFLISFAEGTDDVRFFIDGAPVATGTTFDMSNYTGSVQLYIQLQKTNDNNTDSVVIDRASINGVR